MRVHATGRRLTAVPSRRLALLALLLLGVSCRDDRVTAPAARPDPGAPERAADAAVEFYVHSAPEDWQLFMANLTVASMQRGTKVVLVHTTAGDAGRPAAFWQAREAGDFASVAAVLGAGAWSCGAQTVNAHPLQRCARGNVVAYFLRMPDGNYADGTGYGYGSLATLRDQGIATRAIDGSTTYSSWADFGATLRQVMATESAGQAADAIVVHAPDFDRTINPNDHPDNSATGDAVRLAVQGLGYTLTWYVDYRTSSLPVNLTQAEYDTKARVFNAYDSVMVARGYAADGGDPEVQRWLWRTYFRVSSPVPPAAPGGLQATAAGTSRIDLQWTDNSTSETGFEVERAPDNNGAPGAFAAVGTAGLNATSYIDLSVSSARRYWYRVRAYNDGGSSAYSNTASATTLSSIPLPYRGDAYIVAHADDWQIFMDAMASFQGAASMLFIYTTAGDAGWDEPYWVAREQGSLASIDRVIGAGTWGCASRTVRGHPIRRCTRGNVVSYFMRMPDGNYLDGNGYGYGSLARLRDNGIATSPRDGSTTYTTWADFTATVGAIVDLELDGQAAPYVKVYAPEYDRARDPGDHPDHNATGDAVRAASLAFDWDVSYYVGYDTENRPVNISDTRHAEKQAQFLAYDNYMVSQGYPSNAGYSEYQAWLWRSYSRLVQGTSATLKAPTNLQLAPLSTASIGLTWVDNANDESGFNIERAPDVGGSAGTYAQVATVGANVTTFTNTGLAAGTRYWYRVQASNATGTSAYTNAAAATTLLPPLPAAPSALAASGVSGTQVNLTWADNASDESGYRIERAPDAGGAPGTFAEIATVGASVTTYASTGLAPSTTYWYRVRAYNAAGTSAYSNSASGTTSNGQPAAPTALVATATSATAIALAWADNASDETGYLVERAPNSGGAPGTFVQVASLAANVTSYSNTGLTSATTYWYRVRAAGPVNSAYSNTASATTATTRPAAPSNFVATGASTSQINLTWTDNAINETSYTLQRAPDNNGSPGAYATVATLAANSTGYSNTGLAVNTRYWYRVRATNAAGSSAWVVTNGTTLASVP